MVVDLEMVLGREEGSNPATSILIEVSRSFAVIHGEYQDSGA